MPKRTPLFYLLTPTLTLTLTLGSSCHPLKAVNCLLATDNLRLSLDAAR